MDFSQPDRQQLIAAGTPLRACSRGRNLGTMALKPQRHLATEQVEE